MAKEERSRLPARDWEAEQRHATFFQSQVNGVQQAAIAAQTAGAILVTVGLAMSKMSGISEGNDWAVLLMAIVGWLALEFRLVAGFAGSALRVRHRYLMEWAERFPASPAYQLESFLFDFAHGFSPLFRKHNLDVSGLDTNRQPALEG